MLTQEEIDAIAAAVANKQRGRTTLEVFGLSEIVGGVASFERTQIWKYNILNSQAHYVELRSSVVSAGINCEIWSQGSHRLATIQFVDPAWKP